jgi:polysaccharide export outer membrane protein
MVFYFTLNARFLPVFRRVILLGLWVGGLFLSKGCQPRPPVIEYPKNQNPLDFIVSEEGDANGVNRPEPYSRDKKNRKDKGKAAKKRDSNQDPRIVGAESGSRPALAHRDRAALIPEYFDPYQPISEQYILSTGDVLEISIFGQADTTVEDVVIAPDGRLYYMFLKGILAQGKTIRELKAEITEKAKELFVDPEVSIIPKRVSGQTYVVLGKVHRPGVYPINGSTTLQQAIGGAGGISLGGYAGTTINISNLRDSFIVRNGKKLDIDFERLIYTDGFDQNIFVRPGDYIYIASSLFQEVYLLGEVRESKPIPYKDGLTLTAVLAGVSGTTEGWSDQAHITRIIIVRGSLDHPCWYEVDVLKILHGEARDIYLLPGDIVYVQKKPFRFGRELVRLAIDAFVGSYGAAAGEAAAGRWFR